MERRLHPSARNVPPVARDAPTASRRVSVSVPHRQVPRTDDTVVEPVVELPAPPLPQKPKTDAPVLRDTTRHPHKSTVAPSLHGSRGDSTYFEIKPPTATPRRPTPARSEPLVDQMQEPEVQPMPSGQSDISKTPKRAQRRRSFGLGKPHVLQGMAALLFIFGMYVAIDGWLGSREASEQAQVLSSRAGDEDSSGDDEVLDEKAPAHTSTYKVAPDLPRILEIPSIGVSTRVLQLGVKSDNSLAAPSNIHDAGWYTGSAKPTATAGAMLMDGHVSGPTKNGVFYDLKKLKAGDDIVVERGDGQRLTFAVMRVETIQVESVDMGELMRSDDPSKLGLNLITCGGLFDARTNTFRSQVLVFSVQK